MATKRPGSPEFVSNPFIKKKNLEWSIDITGLAHDATSSSSSDDGGDTLQRQDEKQPTASAIEAGKARINNHLDHFSALLDRFTLSPFPLQTPHLPVKGYRKLYELNVGSPQGAHFIVHQHDHPIAGTHYDLRLQINETSSASWAIMYGLPGDPNSFRLNRNATETRIHCLWNHLVEAGSHASGSLLIWDTGTYTVLPTESKQVHDDSQSSADDEESSAPQLTEQQKLHEAFASRKIRIQLHGTRLPSPYVLNLRLTREEDATGRARSTRIPKTRQRRGAPSALSDRVTRSTTKGNKRPEPNTSSDSEREDDSALPRQGITSRKQKEEDEVLGGHDEDEEGDIVLAPAEQIPKDEKDTISPTERELRELEDDEVRRTNAYPGATNSIGSMYQRRWYLSLDREASGFMKRRKGRGGRFVWESSSNPNDDLQPLVSKAEGCRRRGAGRVLQKESEADKDEEGLDQGEHEGAIVSRLRYPFCVRGVEHERSVVTGRLGSEVLRDENVVGYVGRKGWQAILK